MYLFGTLFSGSFMGIFVSVILLLSLDFWTVKNVSADGFVKDSDTYVHAHLFY